MIEKLAALNEKYDRLTEQVADPALMADQAEWQKLVKARAEIEDVVLVYRRYLAARDRRREAEELLAEKPDPDLAELAQAELDDCSAEMEGLEQQMKLLLLPKDPNDSKNVLLEIRAGTGGDEASLFAADLFKMYSRYAELHRWRTEIMDSSFTDLGGVKEVVMMVEGKGAYSRLKFESGVHRVQRVPATESAGRIHTSAATVAVLPEAEEVEGISTPRISASTCSAPPAPAASASIPPSPLCASPTCPQASWSPVRTKSPRSRTRPRACGCCGPGCWKRCGRRPPTRKPRPAAPWWAPGIAPSASAPTISRSAGSRITASVSPCTSWIRYWKASWTRSSTP